MQIKMNTYNKNDFTNIFRNYEKPSEPGYYVSSTTLNYIEALRNNPTEIASDDFCKFYSEYWFYSISGDRCIFQDRYWFGLKEKP